MKNIKNTPVVLTVIIIILAVGVTGLLLYIKNQPAQVRGFPPLTEIKPMEPDSTIWGISFPNEYSSLIETKENNTRTKYGGSEPLDKLAADPNLVQLFAGFSFAKGYTEDRGHQNSLVDVRSSKRISEKTPGTCYSCKSTDNPKLWAAMGIAGYDAMKFSELGIKINNPIGCTNCHEAGTMKLVVTNPALENALLLQGKDWRNYSRQEMRSVVCANCHVTYYFEKEGNLLTLPWKYGTNIDQIDKYYTENGFADWIHAKDGAPMIKVRHPDYELFSAGSTHYNAGVSCADCHMPYERDGAVKFSDHNIKSPLLEPAESCGQCHSNVEYVVQRVETIQDQVHQTMINTENALINAIDTIATASNTINVDQAKLATARDQHRRAQLRWDFIAAENGMGFHNPEEALRILAESTDMARQAQIIAIESMK